MPQQNRPYSGCRVAVLEPLNPNYAHEQSESDFFFFIDIKVQIIPRVTNNEKFIFDFWLIQTKL